MKLGSICNRQVVTADTGSTAIELAKLMLQKHVGSVVITENKPEGECPIGIVTDRDLVLKVVARDVNPHSAIAEELMTRNLITGQTGDDVLDTMRHMRAHGVRRIPVVNHSQILVGIIALDDLIDVIVNELSELSNVISSSQYKEKLQQQAGVA